MHNASASIRSVLCIRHICHLLLLQAVPFGGNVNGIMKVCKQFIFELNLKKLNSNGNSIKFNKNSTQVFTSLRRIFEG